LKLDKMEISGFKSFYDRTEIEFPDGITAVVGPNGCGKSNIADAISWVLGAQSPKSLRGSSMQDVIFGGSDGRKPLGLAEVSLHLASTNGPLPSGEHNVVVTRRLFRTGESEYLLDGKRVRLQDVRDLMARSYVGSHSYAIIEQGKIAEIVNANPKDRRVLIEDAAGVTGYKHRRRLAELKLEATRANLLRVQDILAEVEKQIRSLKRQAAKARRYRRLREELRRLQGQLFRLRHEALTESLRHLDGRLEEVGAREASVSAGLARAEVSSESLKESIRETDAAFGAAREEMHALDLEIDRTEGLVRSCRERAEELGVEAEKAREEAGSLSELLESRRGEAAARLCERETVAESLSALEASIGRAVEGQESLREEASRLRGELEARRQAHLEASGALAEKRNAIRAGREAAALEREELARVRESLAEVEREIEAQSARQEELGRTQAQVQLRREDLAAARSAARGERDEAREARERAESEHDGVLDRHRIVAGRLAALEQLDSLYAGQDAVREVLRLGPAEGVRPQGVVADFVSVSRDMEEAVEGGLADLLPVLVVASVEEAREGVRLLRRIGAGRVTFLPRGAEASRPAEPGLPPELAAEPGVLGSLSERLELRDGLNGAVEARLARAVLVEDLDRALHLAPRWPGRDWVTREGDLLDRRGLVSGGGAGDEETGLLARRRRLEELRGEERELALAEDRLATARQEARERFERAATRLEQLGESLAAEERSGEVVQVRLEKLREEQERTRRRREDLAAEERRREETAARREAETEETVRQAALHQSECERLEAEMEEAGHGLAAREESMARAVEELGRLRAEEAATRERHEALAAETERLEAESRDLETRLEDLRDRSASAEGKARELVAKAEQGRGSLREAGERRWRAEERSRESERKLREEREALESREEELRRVRSELEAVREERSALALERERAASDDRHIRETCREDLGEELEVVIARLAEGDEEEPGEPGPDTDALADEVATLRERLSTLGAVNMMAVEQFDELDERYRFLTSQRDDLESSIESLQATIRKINRTSRERFEEAFAAIRENFREIFPRLFDGGSADLRLEDEEDPLECGIIMAAQPPGKRMGRTSLMSGGEKALAAVALLFSIFRYQPSPFCLLDEVDAPLDDVNVGRFGEMLREYCDRTQFILITHNKQSMESADLLYGVTMPEPGITRMVSMALD
jgi:chromosome segregation protein